MLRSLRKRPRSDKLANQLRKPGGNWGRRVYLALLILFMLAMSNFLWGDFLLLRSVGLVLRDENVVALTHVARVGSVNVEEGETVRRGDVILHIDSTEVLERLADLSIRLAELTQQKAELELRSEVAARLLPLAEKREYRTSEVLRRIENLDDRGLITSASYDEFMRAKFDAQENHIRLAVESKSLSRQIADLEAARKDAISAIEKLETYYADGLVRAETDGSIGADLPSIGSVYRPGEPILTIHSGDAYILAYLPSRYLFPIDVGTNVEISSGRHRDRGVISEILPLSDALPMEFQNTFRPRERNQLAKIMLSNPSRFPVLDKVEITRSYIWSSGLNARQQDDPQRSPVETLRERMNSVTSFPEIAP